MDRTGGAHKSARTIRGNAMPPRQTKLRLCRLFVVMFINYLDRMNLSVAAKDIAAAYGLSRWRWLRPFSAFLCTYPSSSFRRVWRPIASGDGRSPMRASASGRSPNLHRLATSYTAMFASRLCSGPARPRAIRPAGASHGNGHRMRSAASPWPSSIAGPMRVCASGRSWWAGSSSPSAGGLVLRHRGPRHRLAIAWYALYHPPRRLRG